MPVAMVASRQRYDDPSARLPAHEQWRGVDIHRVWTSQFGRARLLGRAFDYLTFYACLPAALWRLLQRGDVVVAKTDPPLVSLVVAVVAKLRGAVLVNWLQDVFPEIAVTLGQPPIPRPLAWLLKRLRDRSLRGAAMNVTIGGRMAEYFVAQGIPAHLVQVIPNWAHEDVIRPMLAEHSRLRRELGLQNRFVVGYSGNLGRAHDVETLFDAMQRSAREPAIAFLIIGGGHGYEVLQRQVDERGLQNVYFQPYQPLAALSDSMAAADLHLVSLRPELEGQIVPSKFYGIAAAERAVGFIGDLDGELARLIADGDCGFSVAPGRGDLLVEQITRLAAEPDVCHAQGRRARLLLEDRFSRKGSHERWYHLLPKLGARGTT